jgi:deferrochelatase/peroxidase EfeB
VARFDLGRKAADGLSVNELSREDEAVSAADPPASIQLELEDIQGLAVFGYHLPFFCFQFLKVHAPEPGRAWISRVVDQVTTAVRRNEAPHPCLNLGFTSAGLVSLGVPPSLIEAFEPAFRQGIESRSEILGDTGTSHPERWEGRLGTPDVHALLMLFARTTEELDGLVREQKEIRDSIDGVELLSEQPAAAFPDPDGTREHFGFRDGISRVTLKGSGTESFPGSPWWSRASSFWGIGMRPSCRPGWTTRS